MKGSESVRHSLLNNASPSPSGDGDGKKTIVLKNKKCD